MNGNRQHLIVSCSSQAAIVAAALAAFMDNGHAPLVAIGHSPGGGTVDGKMESYPVYDKFGKGKAAINDGINETLGKDEIPDGDGIVDGGHIGKVKINKITSAWPDDGTDGSPSYVGADLSNGKEKIALNDGIGHIGDSALDDANLDTAAKFGHATDFDHVDQIAGIGSPSFGRHQVTLQ